eukprot:scaffold668858_cov57-Prasinocladus_malaysianus.AAC.1
MAKRTEEAAQRALQTIKARRLCQQADELQAELDLASGTRARELRQQWQQVCESIEEMEGSRSKCCDSDPQQAVTDLLAELETDLLPT